MVLSLRHKLIFGSLVFIILSILGYSAMKQSQNNQIVILTGQEQITGQEDVQAGEIMVHITGMVQNPGIVKLKEGDRIDDAIKAVGGVTEKADLNAVNLAYKLSDGQKIYIPEKNAPKVNTTVNRSTSAKPAPDNSNIR